MRLARYDALDPSKELRARFESGQASLDRWLAMQAGQSMASRDAVTHLLYDDRAAAIAGYFCLSAGEIRKESAPTRMGKELRFGYR